jgi:hypothetical protein
LIISARPFFEKTALVLLMEDIKVEGSEEGGNNVDAGSSGQAHEPDASDKVWNEEQLEDGLKTLKEIHIQVGTHS